MDKVLIGPMPLFGVQAKYAEVLRSAGFELLYNRYGHQMNEAELLDILPGVRASLAGSEPYTAKVLDAHPQLKIIARAGVGYDAVDVPAATSRGVAVCFAPGTNQDAVAEHTFVLM